MSEENPTDAEFADQFYRMDQHFLPEEMAAMEIQLAEMQASIAQASEEFDQRIAAGEVNPDSLARPGEGPNHHFVRLIHQSMCSCATDPEHCYPHGGSKSKI